MSDNLWLNSLRNDLVAAQLERFAQVPQSNLPMDAYTFAIGEANTITIEEMNMQKKKGYILSEKLDALFFAKSKADITVNILWARFKKVPKETEKAFLAMTDTIALDSWAVHVATCSSLDEFVEALK